MANAIVLLIIVAILTISIRKIIKEKKSGAKCIGCPNCTSCNKQLDDNNTIKIVKK